MFCYETEPPTYMIGTAMLLRIKSTFKQNHQFNGYSVFFYFFFCLVASIRFSYLLFGAFKNANNTRKNLTHLKSNTVKCITINGKTHIIRNRLNIILISTHCYNQMNKATR